MERALETQRAALLRILSGLVFALAFVSFAPAVSMLPRWVCTNAASVLSRAESAANNLVFVSACLLFGSQTAAAMPRSTCFFEQGRESEETIESLLRRITVLRTVLEDLPRYARRLFRRRLRKTESPVRDHQPLCAGHLPPRPEPCRARIERPPKSDGGFSRIF